MGNISDLQWVLLDIYIYIHTYGLYYCMGYFVLDYIGYIWIIFLDEWILVA